jgi:hypothetical protein
LPGGKFSVPPKIFEIPLSPPNLDPFNLTPLEPIAVPSPQPFPDLQLDLDPEVNTDPRCRCPKANKPKKHNICYRGYFVEQRIGEKRINWEKITCL